MAESNKFSWLTSRSYTVMPLADPFTDHRGVKSPSQRWAMGHNQPGLAITGSNMTSSLLFSVFPWSSIFLG